MKHSTGNKFVKVNDRRGKPIEGLWQRNSNYYAQLRLIDPATGKGKLTKKRLAATNPTEAKAALVDLLSKRDGGTAPPVTVPTFQVYALQWLESYRLAKIDKPRSFDTRQSNLKPWMPAIGGRKLNTIGVQDIRALKEDWQRAGVSNNTVIGRMDVLAIIFKQAIGDRLIVFNPIPHVTRPPAKKATRTHFTAGQIHKFADALGGEPSYGCNPRDYFLLLAYTGARRLEALTLTWDRVDFEKRQLNIYGSKTNKERFVDFHPLLESLLRDMHDRKPPSKYLFPSYHSNAQHAVSPPKAWKDVIEKTGIDIHPHDLRHYFISQCVMSGCDWLSIANWSGHSDANMLAKVYAHLRPEYQQQQAAKIVFEPATKKAA